MIVGIRRLLATCALPLATMAAAAPPLPPPPPHAEAAPGYREYRLAAPAKAFVVAPGGVWTWRAQARDTEAALAEALADCRARTRQPCVPYALDDRVVFDARGWAGLWTLPGGTGARRAPVGNARGERFPDLACQREDGRRQTLSGLRGKVVILHFWGSWCGPCRKELPDFQSLRAALKDEPGIVFLFVQVREPADHARAWLRGQGLRLPVCDSGSTGANDDRVRLADGGIRRDRELARVFPSTYVLDGDGRVLFGHAGAVADWREYLPLLRHAATRARGGRDR
jgi:thiol-disulfide isomerase/thioredoxin